MARLFISQERMNSWTSEDKIRVEGETMTLVGDGRCFRVEPAVRFLKVSGDGPDPHGLVGKVKTVASLEGMGGEHFMESVILGDTAYDVQTGFIGVPIAA
jgi:hypothetical protein